MQEMLFSPSVYFQSLPADRFNKQWRESATIAKCSISAVDTFVYRHYLRCRPGVAVLCLKVFIKGVPVGAIIYALPPMETENRYGGKTWELARLYLIDEIPRNAETWVISQSVKYIRRNYPDVKFLVSYADPSAGHCGTIYKAANWIADGQTDSERKSPRCHYVDAAGKKYSRKSHLPVGVAIVRQPRVSKHRFYLKLAD